MILFCIFSPWGYKTFICYFVELFVLTKVVVTNLFHFFNRCRNWSPLAEDSSSTNFNKSPSWTILCLKQGIYSSLFESTTLSRFKYSSNLDLGRAFVRKSTIFSSVLTFRIFTTHFSMMSRTKCNFTSIGLVLSWYCWFFVRWIALWLSHISSIVSCL